MATVSRGRWNGGALSISADGSRSLRNLEGRRPILVGLIVAFLVGAACAPTDGRGQPGQRDSSGQGPAAPKILTIAVQQEPSIFIEPLAQTNVRAGGGNASFNIVHNFLVVRDHTEAYRPQIASEMPSLENGTWRLNRDGTMDLTWKIHPNVRWHDGTPFTADDLVFSFAVYKDREIPNGIGPFLADFESVTALDAHTLIAHWSRPFVDADQAHGLVPLPRHLFAELYATNKAGLPSSSLLSTEFVGLGPYRLVRWESGSYIEYAGFDDYHRGRPPLDRLIVQVIGDPNTMIANILSGAVDIIPAIGLDTDATVEVTRRWEGTANRAIPQLRGGIRQLELQYRPEYARPPNGLTNLAVRQAFYHAIDRQTLAEAMGIGPAADSWFSPTDALRPEVEVSIPQFPYDPARATRLLSQAGWVRGADGVLTDQRTGARFEIQLTARGPRDAKEQLIIADNWKALGAQLDLYSIPAALQADKGHTSMLPGAWLATIQPYHFITQYFHSGSITSLERGWTGQNRGGYSNPKLDALLDTLTATIPRTDRIVLYRELLREQMGDLPGMVLYWEGDILLAVRGVKGIENAKGGGAGTWNVFEWDKE